MILYVVTFNAVELRNTTPVGRYSRLTTVRRIIS